MSKRVMIYVERYQSLRIEVKRSPETNDFDEVLFLADGVDLIERYWSDMIGLDPHSILVEPCPLRAGPERHLATIARCFCGEISCVSVQVEIQRSEDCIVWYSAEYTDTGHPTRLEFDPRPYDAEVERALSERS